MRMLGKCLRLRIKSIRFGLINLEVILKRQLKFKQNG